MTDYIHYYRNSNERQLESLYRGGSTSRLYFSASTKRQFVETDAKPPLVMVFVEVAEKVNCLYNSIFRGACNPESPLQIPFTNIAVVS
jgi:hypothetical protein